ncbi:MAG: carboxymuconolactone decarboxylase family protein [Chloroflexi bacterium]|nr:carboxymuconolactone decarboxylase family protein [Chloroflexota bacterium]MDA1145324.1 carboxymuconolactone decarboxylase family protein [Chloroflexota bacterium]
MAGVAPLPPEEIENYEHSAEGSIARMGFVLNSTKTMSRRPEIRDALSRLFVTVFNTGEVESSLKHMVAQVSSVAAGCRYCQAHTANSAARSGVPAAKIEALYDFEASPHFNAAERAALRFARDASIQPNATTPAHFQALREHFDEAQIVELTAAIATFGFLNRWNDTMGTELEDEPIAFASEHLAHSGWEVGKHQ